jgi:hypothetical protein
MKTLCHFMLFVLTVLSSWSMSYASVTRRTPVTDFGFTVGDGAPGETIVTFTLVAGGPGDFTLTPQLPEEIVLVPGESLNRAGIVGDSIP